MMKKKLITPVLLLSLFISLCAMTPGFWDLYVDGPDSRCGLDAYDYGEWTMEDTYGDPVDPNNQYEWFINDYDAQQQGYPSYSLGRPAYDIDRELNAYLSFGSGYDELSEVIITCKITNNGQTRYEGITVENCN